jgi:predicted aspartyl protease
MGATTMGRVVVEAKVFNNVDEIEVKRGTRPPDQVRSVTIPDALVDSGATLLELPASVIQQLGLVQKRSIRARTANGVREFAIYEPVRLIVQNRECTVEVMELSDGTPALIGQFPLELLDFVVDLRGQRLVGDPFHGGEQMLDAF